MTRSKAGYRRGQKHIRNLRLYEVHKNGRAYWRLRTPDPSGQGFSERQFSCEAEALSAFETAYIAHLNHGVKAGSLGAKERGEALAALDILKPFSISLVDAARYYSSHHTGVLDNRQLSDVVTELLAAKKQDGLSHRYLLDLHARLGRFTREFGARKIAELSQREIESWLRDLKVGPLARNTLLMRLHVLFEFARSRRWCATNPVTEIPKAKWIGCEPSVLSPEQFGRLLEAADPETLPYWAIGGWCGLRSAELERLEWQDIDFEAGLVEVTRGKSNTGARRHVVIREALAAWLLPYRSRTIGKVCPSNLRRRLEADRARAGLADWPPNALRHSFASYCLEFFKRPGELTVEMGHTDEDLVSRHYRRRVRPEAARAWWSMMPPTHERKIIELELAS